MAVVMLGGCSSDDVSSDGDRSTSSSTDSGLASSTSAPDVEAEVREAYLAYWRTYDRLLEAPDPDDPELRERTIGEALTFSVDGLAALKAAGERALVPTDPADNSHSLSAVVVDGRSATLRDCYVDGHVVVGPDGAARNATVATKDVRVELRLISDVWKVSTAQILTRVEGRAACVD